MKSDCPGESYHPQGSPRSLYIHIPFCRHRCGYCNFALVADRGDLVERYLNALETEIQWLPKRYAVDTVFLGGGTPSYLSRRQLARVKAMIDSRFEVSDSVEFSAECNPSDLDLNKANSLREMGVNRLSLGVQSFNQTKLERLERDHSPEGARHAIKLAQSVFSSVSIDLIFAGPNESYEQWVADLSSAVATGADHFSTYELTYEKGTQFWNRFNRGELVPAGEDLRADMYELTIQQMQDRGWVQYEVSSFSRPGHRSRHNQAYWNGNDYFAFGPGAARFIDGVRETNHRSTTQYIKLIESGETPVFESEKLSERANAVDRIVFGLRMTDGFDSTEVAGRTGYRVSDVLGDFGETLVAQGLLEYDGSRCRLTSAGIMVYDAIAAEIYCRPHDRN